MISPIATGIAYRIETSWPVIEANTGHEPPQHSIAHLPQYANRVFTFYLLRRMHQSIGKLTVSGEHQ
jgi:hypothetical protein